MSIVTRTLIVDPDTGERREKLSFKLGQATTKEDFEALYRFLVSKSSSSTLKVARQKLIELRGFPERRRAVKAVWSGRHFAKQGLWERANAAISDFAALYERAMHRKVLRDRNKARVAGGKNSAAKRIAFTEDRNAKIRARYRQLIDGGSEPRLARQKCAFEWRTLSVSQIGKILSK